MVFFWFGKELITSYWLKQTHTSFYDFIMHNESEMNLVTSSGGNRTQVDYILYRVNFRKNVTNVKVIPGEEMAQQHILLVCDFRVCLPSLRERKFVPRLRT